MGELWTEQNGCTIQWIWSEYHTRLAHVALHGRLLMLCFTDCDLESECESDSDTDSVSSQTYNGNTAFYLT